MALSEPDVMFAGPQHAIERRRSVVQHMFQKKRTPLLPLQRRPDVLPTFVRPCAVSSPDLRARQRGGRLLANNGRKPWSRSRCWMIGRV